MSFQQLNKGISLINHNVFATCVCLHHYVWQCEHYVACDEGINLLTSTSVPLYMDHENACFVLFAAPGMTWCACMTSTTPASAMRLFFNFLDFQWSFNLWIGYYFHLRIISKILNMVWIMLRRRTYQNFKEPKLCCRFVLKLVTRYKFTINFPPRKFPTQQRNIREKNEQELKNGSRRRRN